MTREGECMAVRLTTFCLTTVYAEAQAMRAAQAVDKLQQGVAGSPPHHDTGRADIYETPVRCQALSAS